MTVTTDANHQFSNGGESTTLSCTINRKLVDEPSCTSATYNGSSQTLLAAHTNGGYTNEAIVGTNA